MMQERETKIILNSGTYWLTRIVFLRCFAFIYQIAFLVALHQNKQLVGSRGLTPLSLHLKSIEDHLKSVGKNDAVAKLNEAPTLLWFAPMQHIDAYLDYVAYAGLAISFVVMVTGASNMVAMLLLWVLYHSLVNVGQRWYSFGWESQMLETGFLAMWFCPLLAWTQLPEKTPPSRVVVIGYRWLIFRIMLGAGLIKIRGDQCWRDLTCMDYHYETQCVPNPFAYLMHQSPGFIHKLETGGNHFVELIVPFFMFSFVRILCITAGILQIAFMAIIIISGNLSFLNHLTMLPSICCFDDKLLASFFCQKTIRKVADLQKNKAQKGVGQYIRQGVHTGLLVLLIYLSAPVVQNLISPRQRMNTSYDPLRLVNTYGAFGSITKERTEVVMQGTSAADPNSANAVWLDYEFNCKPGNVTRRPCLISPYHYRLDWLMWFAAFQNYQQNPWLVHLVARMLQNDAFMSELIEHNPFLVKGEPPKWIRLEHYRYQYTKIGSDLATKGQWWKRKRIGQYMQPVNLQMLKPFLKRFLKS